MFKRNNAEELDSETIQLREYLNSGIKSGADAQENECRLKVSKLIINRANLWSSSSFENYVRNAIMEQYNVTVQYILSCAYYLQLREVLAAIRCWLYFWLVSVFYLQFATVSKTVEMITSLGGKLIIINLYTTRIFLFVKTTKNKIKISSK